MGLGRRSATFTEEEKTVFNNRNNRHSNYCCCCNGLSFNMNFSVILEF